MAAAAATDVGADEGPTSPRCSHARIAGCKASAELERRLTGDTGVFRTVGVHICTTCFGGVKYCVSRARTAVGSAVGRGRRTTREPVSSSGTNMDIGSQ